jgi:hypothetical protein
LENEVDVVQSDVLELGEEVFYGDGVVSRQGQF